MTVNSLIVILLVPFGEQLGWLKQPDYGAQVFRYFRYLESAWVHFAYDFAKSNL